MKIINRDFSVLNNKTAINKWGMKSVLSLNEEKDILTVWFYESNKDDPFQIPLGIIDAPEEYLEVTLKHYGFNVEIIIGKQINTFEEFKEFLKCHEMDYSPHRTYVFYDIDCATYFGKKEIEERYSVVFNLDI